MMQAQSPVFDQVSELEQQQELTELRENRHRLQQLVEGLAAAVYTCNADGYITSYNKAAAKLWGREPELGKDLWCGSWKIYQPDGVTPLPLDSCPMAVALREGRSVRGIEILVERPDGGRHNVMPYPDPIFDSKGNVIEAVNMLVDITELKQKENALRESERRLKQIAEELEKRVEERTKDLKEANTALQRSNLELEQFAFIASHDMQEPLRKIKTFTSRLQKTTSETFDETGKTYLDKIKTSSERMGELIENVLNYSRLIYLDKQFVQTDLNMILEAVLNDFELSIEEKKAIIKAQQLPILNAIPLQMRQLFHNILSNALKFCNTESPCTLEIFSEPLTKEEAIVLKLNENISYFKIIFSDNGIGFKQDFAENIFKIFQRLHEKERYPGTGIGLALCRKIIDIHKGEIYAESMENKGTSIYVILPV